MVKHGAKATRPGNRRPPIHPSTKIKLKAMRTAPLAASSSVPETPSRLRSPAAITAALSLLYLSVSLGWSEQQGSAPLVAAPPQGSWGASPAEWVGEGGWSICQCWPCDLSVDGGDATDPSPSDCPRLFVSGVGSLRAPLPPNKPVPARRRVYTWPSEDRVCRGRAGAGLPAPEGAAGSIAACGAVRSGGAVPGGGRHLIEKLLHWAALGLWKIAPTAARALAVPDPTTTSLREAAGRCIHGLPGRWILWAGDSNVRNLCVMLVQALFGLKPWDCRQQSAPEGAGGGQEGEGGAACWRTRASPGRATLWSDWDIVGGSAAGEMAGLRVSFRFVGRDVAKVERIFNRPQDVHARYYETQVPRWEDPNGRAVHYLLNVSEPALRAEPPPPQLVGPAPGGRRGGPRGHDPEGAGGGGGDGGGGGGGGVGEDLPGFLVYQSSLWGIWPVFHPQKIGAHDLETGGEQGVAAGYDAAAERTGRGARGVEGWWGAVWGPTYAALRRYQERGGRVAYASFGPIIGSQQQMTNLHAAMINARVAFNLSAVGVPMLDVMRLGLEAPRGGWIDAYHLPDEAGLRAIDGLLSAACPGYPRGAVM